MLRDAVLQNAEKMRLTQSNPGRELFVGGFRIQYCAPGEMGPLRGFLIDVWPPAKPIDRADGVFFRNKVCSAEWWQDGSIKIMTFKSGPWDAELLSHLSDRQNVSEIDWHRRRRLSAPC